MYIYVVSEYLVSVTCMDHNLVLCLCILLYVCMYMHIYRYMFMHPCTGQSSATY